MESGSGAIVEKKKKKKGQDRLRSLKKYNYFILLPDDPLQVNWDLYITLILFFTFIVTPFRIAFTNDDNLAWTIADGVIDFMFLIDIILNFFMAYYNNEYILIDKRTKIAVKYITTWFFIDLVAVVPFNLLIPSSSEGNSDYGSLARLTKLPRLYRLVKMLRLVRILKLLKQRTKVMGYF